MNEQKTKEIYRNAFTGPVGAAVLEDLVSTYVLAQNPYREPGLMARFEGRRDLVLLILSLVYDRIDDSVDYLLTHKEGK